MFSFRKSLRRYGGKKAKKSSGKKSSGKKAKKSSGNKGTGKKGKGKKKTLGKKKTRPKKTQKKQKIKGHYTKKKATAKKAKKAKKATRVEGPEPEEAMPMPMPTPKHLDPGVMKSIMQHMDNPTNADNFAKAFRKRAPKGMEVAQKLNKLKEYGDYEYDGDFSYTMDLPCGDPDVMERILSILFEFDVVNLTLACDLNELPINIGELSNLKELELVTPRLTGLPHSLTNLRNLRLIQIEGDPVKGPLPNSILDQICDMLGGLTRLYVFNCGFTQIPNSISYLKNLEVLSIVHCPMDEYQITPEIGSLTNLTTLTLIDMNLRSLPEEIGNLTNLQELYASNNQLDSLPDSFGNLTNLTTLSLNQNQFNNTFPNNSSGLGGLTRLETLLLRDNPITVFPPSIQALIEVEGSLITRDNVYVELPGSDSDESHVSGTDGESNFGSEDSVVSEADGVLVTDSDEEPLVPPTDNPFPTINANAQNSSSEELG